MKLSSIFGLRSRLRQLRIAAGEGALAAKDRVLLLRLAWEEEKQRLVVMLALAIVLIGLTTVTVSLLSVAIVVHFWDTPNRVTAAWSVAGAWIALWVIAAFALMATLRKASEALEPAKHEFERDWAWIQQRFHLGEDDEGEARRPERPVTRDELLARIATQRKRVDTVATPAPPKGTLSAAPPANESTSAAALRIARENPVAAGAAAAAVVAVIGPRRLLRWAAVIGPIAWRMRDLRTLLK